MSSIAANFNKIWFVAAKDDILLKIKQHRSATLLTIKIRFVAVIKNDLQKYEYLIVSVTLFSYRVAHTIWLIKGTLMRNLFRIKKKSSPSRREGLHLNLPSNAVLKQ